MCCIPLMSNTRLTGALRAQIANSHLPWAARAVWITARRPALEIAVSGGNYSGEYLAFSLPETEADRRSTQ